MSFERFADPRCQRGLTFLYRLQHAIDPDAFSALLGPELARSQQQWGTRLVHIWIAPRRYECQLGSRDLEMRFMHRVSASSQQRAIDRLHFEAALARALSA